MSTGRLSRLEPPPETAARPAGRPSPSRRARSRGSRRRRARRPRPAPDGRPRSRRCARHGSAVRVAGHHQALERRVGRPVPLERRAPCSRRPCRRRPRAVRPNPAISRRRAGARREHPASGRQRRLPPRNCRAAVARASMARCSTARRASRAAQRNTAAAGSRATATSTPHVSSASTIARPTSPRLTRVPPMSRRARPAAVTCSIAARIASCACAIAEVLEHHRPAPDLADRVRDALARRCRAPSRAPARTATGSLRSGLMLADGAMPIVPVQAGPRSDRMSPNRLEATTTSNQCGLRTKCAVRMSMWNLSSLHVRVVPSPSRPRARPSTASR